jgi:hypothetical protein
MTHPRQAARSLELRRRIAQEAARVMAQSGGRNFLQAKRKAAEQLGVSDARHLPSNREVEDALAAYQRLFLAERQGEELQRLRRTAAEAMRFLAAFAPRLVGPVLEGTADTHSEVNLHLFSDSVEEVGHFLRERGVPAALSERRLRLAAEVYAGQPEYRFLAGGVPIALTVFAGPAGRQSPLSPVDGRPMRRASLAELERLLAPGNAPGG